MGCDVVHAGCRIRSVRDKASGFVLHLLKPQTERARASFLRDVRDMVDRFHRDGSPIVGYAVVIWGADGASMAALRAGEGSSIPSIAMPEFIKNRLIAAKIDEGVHS